MDSVITVIRQCQQRGEAPLSVIDLVERELLTATQAAWLIDRIQRGSSWLVGALPGGAGKTTLMSALLAFVPDGENAVRVSPQAPWPTYGRGWCAVSEEISDHGLPNYLWGADVRGLASVPAQGGRITATIHADTLEQAREQIACQCGAREEGLAAFQLFIPIEVRFADEAGPSANPRHRAVAQRTVTRIYYHEEGAWRTLERAPAPTPELAPIVAFLDDCRATGSSSCESIRQAWLARG